MTAKTRLCSLKTRLEGSSGRRGRVLGLGFWREEVGEGEGGKGEMGLWRRGLRKKKRD